MQSTRIIKNDIDTWMYLKDELSTFDVVDNLVLNQEFPYGMRNSKKLKTSLKLIGKQHLCQITLLRNEVARKHASKYEKRFLRRWKKHCSKLAKQSDLLTKAVNIDDLTTEHYRFFTLLHKVVKLDHVAALKEIEEFKTQLSTALEGCTGIACLGAVEVEVINVPLMKVVSKINPNVRRDKLRTCESLAINEDVNVNGSAFLIHFHGVVEVQQIDQFDSLRKELKKNINWKVVPSQIELKRLFDEVGGKKKSIEDNFFNISRYITKAGLPLNGGNSYLKYNVDVDKQNLSYLNHYIINSIEAPDVFLQLKKIPDALSLSSYEIAELAQLVHGMMGLNNSRTGYEIRVGNW